MVQRAIIYILLFGLTISSNSQHLYKNKWTLGPGEYNNSLINLNGATGFGRLYQLVNLPLSFAIPDSFVQAAGGAHSQIARTINGRAYSWLDNANGQLGQGNTTSLVTPTLIAVDSLGNPMTNVIKVWEGGYHGWNSMILKGDGTLWGSGDMGGGLRGNGTLGGQTTRFVQIPFPAGVFIVDALMSDMMLAVDSTGSLWDCGAYNENNGNDDASILAQGTASPQHFAPTKLTWTTARVKMIAGGFNLVNYAIQVNNQVFAWGPHMRYAGLPSNPSLSTIGYVGWRMDTSYVHYFPAGTSIDTMVVNSLGTYALLTDSTIWFWGSNACAGLGNGPGIDYRHYTGSNGYAPYAFDQGLNEAMIDHPTQVMVGKHNFTKLFASSSINYYAFAEDVNDSIFCVGRNKGGVIGNIKNMVDSSGATSGQLQALFPNGLDVNYWTFIDPFRPNYITRWSCQMCLDSPAYNSLCTTYPVNTSATPPTASAGSNRTITQSWTTLYGVKGFSAGTSGIKEVLWTCTAKPGGAPNPTMPLVANDTVNASNLQIGSYTFQYSVTSSDFKTTTSTVNIVVFCTNCFTKPKGWRHRYFNL